ncbi:MAG: hypothetical protein QF713_04370, partial [Dehalococcoidales bacterium]|nr:hypothetical protein [Dehalococcoidales bacterium]
MGIPTAIIQRRELMPAALTSLMGQGLPPEVPWVVFEYPLFLVNSDLTPLSQKMDQVIDRLISWEPRTKTTGTIIQDPTTVSGRDYEETYRNV